MNTDTQGVKIEYTASKIIELNSKTLLSNHIISWDDKIKESDYYKIIKTQIQQKLKLNGWNTLAVTSPRSGSGKTTTAINLALSIAKDHDMTVMLVDCDLKNQHIHNYLGYKSDYGLADHLLDNIPLEKLIVCPNINRLTVISGGKTISGSTEILGSNKMGAIVHELKSRYDNRYIIFDVPSLLEGADTLAIMPYIDSVVLTIENNNTKHSDCENAINLIDKNKLFGFVINKYDS